MPYALRILALLFIVASLLGSLPLYAAELRKMSVQDAHRKALAAEILLVDVRTPGEWQDTGIGEGARAISMHRPGFITQLQALTGGDKTRPVALICARGGRSKKMSSQLRQLGYSNIIDVSEGMLGSRDGPGWLKAKLPTTPYSE